MHFDEYELVVLVLLASKARRGLLCFLCDAYPGYLAYVRNFLSLAPSFSLSVLLAYLSGSNMFLVGFLVHVWRLISWDLRYEEVGKARMQSFQLILFYCTPISLLICLF